MAITWDQIGSQQFLRVDAGLINARTHFEDVTRPAVDGRAFRLLGIHGVEQKLQAVVDVASRSAANTAMTTYRGMIGDNVTIKQHGQDRTNFKILSVIETAGKQLATGTGGVNGGNYLLATTWTVVHKGTT